MLALIALYEENTKLINSRTTLKNLHCLDEILNNKKDL